jgi:DNA-binding SARP family transcriptional activator
VAPTRHDTQFRDGVDDTVDDTVEGTGRGARLELLGDFRLSFDGEVLTVPSSAQRLLAVLAVSHRGRRARRSALAERLWPDSPAGRGVSNLRSVLWRLPRPRGRILVHGNASTVWLADALRVDLWEAERLARQVRDAHLGGPADVDLSLLRDDLLPDWGEEWLLLEQESFRQKRLHALEHGAAQMCRAGRFTDALEAGLDAVQSEPLRESAHRRVIEVHLAEGNQAEALRQYDGYRRLLARELGLRPSESIRRLVAPLLGRPVDRAFDGPPD